MKARHFLSIVLLFPLIAMTSAPGSRIVSVAPLDRDIIVVHILDGEVHFLDDASGPTAFGGHSHEPRENWVVAFDPPLAGDEAVQPQRWQIQSATDHRYGDSGLAPVRIHRKSKLNGMAQMEWDPSARDGKGDYRYEYTMEHFLFLELPQPLLDDNSYLLVADTSLAAEPSENLFVFGPFQSVSEAIHINLVGYMPGSALKSADLYMWMGDGGPRDYSGFEGNRVDLKDLSTGEVRPAGSVRLWKKDGPEAGGRPLIQSPVWRIDFDGPVSPGSYQIGVEGIGASHVFEVGETIYFEPFRVSVLGFFYMRIGQDNLDMVPVPRRPLWIPGKDPVDHKVIITTMTPYHPDWPGGGDRWDQPDFFAPHAKPGLPENPNAWGGHSDALDWDRHLGHVSIIYDMLLPYLLTGGILEDDDLGIAESGNGLPDIIDAARYEVDFFLRLRDGPDYSHGLTNPNRENIIYQAGTSAIAAWANAVNSAMLAEAFRIAGEAELRDHYTSEALTAYRHADTRYDPMLDILHNVGEGTFRGRDLKMTAAAFLYNLTGDRAFEDVVNDESLALTHTSVLVDARRFNQLYGTAAYLLTPQPVHYPELRKRMKSSILHDAMQNETSFAEQRPSRRSTDNETGYFQTIQNVQRTIVAHAVSDDPAVKAFLRDALLLEADWGLGRNPLNMIQMTTATTNLADHRSVENCYTSGRNDGTPGLHPGHTPYMNADDWGDMIMASPSWMHQKSHPSDFREWPYAELYFNTRFVWAHGEFTPQQTMRGKMALYGYLYALGKNGHRTGAWDHASRLSGSATSPEMPQDIIVYNDSASAITGTWTSNGKLEEVSGDAFEGNRQYQFNFSFRDWWAGFGLIFDHHSQTAGLDLRQHEHLVLAIRQSSRSLPQTTVKLVDQSGNAGPEITIPVQRQYRLLAIPLKDLKGSSQLDLSRISQLQVGFSGVERGRGEVLLDQILFTVPGRTRAVK